MRGILECPEFIIDTTDKLSHQNGRRFPGEKRVPYGAGNNDAKELLPFNTYTLLLVQLHVRRPMALKPLSLEVSPKAYRARSIGV